jgi:hypothetical protein
MAPATACKILDKVDTNYAYNAALADVLVALKEMNRAICAFDASRLMRVLDKVAFYKDANQRASHVAIWKQRNLEQAAKFTAEEWLRR